MAVGKGGRKISVSTIDIIESLLSFLALIIFHTLFHSLCASSFIEVFDTKLARLNLNLLIKIAIT